MNNRAAIQERRNKIWDMLVRGFRGYEIAKELNVDKSTVSRDIEFLTLQSQKYLNDLAKKTLPFSYMQNIEGIKEVLKRCWEIYESTDDRSINWFHKISVLKLIKECNESQFKLLSDSPSVFYLKTLEDKLIEIEQNNGQRV